MNVLRLAATLPADTGTGSPGPVSATGDVRNLDRAPGGNDGTWIDIGHRVSQLPDGRNHKSAMNVLILGCSYRPTPVKVRERLAFTDESAERPPILSSR